MSRRNKLKRFADMRAYQHVFEPDKEILLREDFHMKGQWKKSLFGTDNPLTLEIGCGRGEYTVGLAQAYPDRGFLGMDVKGARMWKGATYALENSIMNVGFVRARVEFIKRIFAPGEVDEIWITFPDPQPKKAARRLVHSSFLNNYAAILAPGGCIHLKTDSRMLHEYLKAILMTGGVEAAEQTHDLYAGGASSLELSLRTRYEEKFLAEGKPITYLRFCPDALKTFHEPDNFNVNDWI